MIPNPGPGSPLPVPGPEGRVPTGPRGGLRVLIALTLVVIVMYAALAGFVESSQEAPPPGTEMTPVVSSVGEGELAGILPEETRRNLERDLHAWFSHETREPLSDREAVDESEWVAHLLSSAVRVPLQGLPDRMFEDVENVPAALERPSAHRGDLARVWGRVESSRKATLDAGDRQVSAVILRLSAHNGATWTVTCAAVSKPPETGTWVKAHGVFVKLWPVAEQSMPALHLFSSRPLVESFPPVTHDEPLVEWMEEVDDSDPVAAAEIEEGPLYGMLNYVRALGPRGYRELRDVDAIEVLDLTEPRAVQDTLVRSPLPHRFRAVRIRAAPLLQQFAMEEDVPENPGNIDFFYRGYVVVDGPLPVWILSPFPNTEFDFRGARNVLVEGFFFKRRWVERQDKKYFMPVIIATSITPVEMEERVTDLGTVVSIVLAGAVVVALLLVVVVFRSRRELDAFRERQAGRRARRGG